MASSSAPNSRREPSSSDTVRAAGSIDDTRRAEQQLDAPLAIELRRPQRNPVVLRLAGQIVFRQVRTIDRRIRIGADHRDRTVVAFAPQHVGGRQPGGAAADDHDRRRSATVRPQAAVESCGAAASRARTPCRPDARRASTRSDRAPARAARSPVRRLKHAWCRGSAPCRRRPVRRRAGRGSACSARRRRTTRRPRADQHLVVADMSQHRRAVSHAVDGNTSREIGCVDLLGVIHEGPLVDCSVPSRTLHRAALSSISFFTIWMVPARRSRAPPDCQRAPVIARVASTS